MLCSSLAFQNLAAVDIRHTDRYLVAMKRLRWSAEKNQLLVQTRGVSFEEIAHHIASDEILDIRKHPNEERYPNQKIFVLELDQYVYLVPFVEDDEEIFLKTIIPSRKAKKEFGND